MLRIVLVLFSSKSCSTTRLTSFSVPLDWTIVTAVNVVTNWLLVPS
jgi:hypothetical protein